jgi:hypothetical protein
LKTPIRPLQLTTSVILAHPLHEYALVVLSGRCYAVVRRDGSADVPLTRDVLVHIVFVDAVVPAVAVVEEPDELWELFVGGKIYGSIMLVGGAVEEVLEGVADGAVLSPVAVLAEEGAVVDVGAAGTC